jgi:hypothetical protein
MDERSDGRLRIIREVISVTQEADVSAWLLAAGAWTRGSAG